jgi:hypothetical protein
MAAAASGERNQKQEGQRMIENKLWLIAGAGRSAAVAATDEPSHIHIRTRRWTRSRVAGAGVTPGAFASSRVPGAQPTGAEQTLDRSAALALAV